MKIIFLLVSLCGNCFAGAQSKTNVQFNFTGKIIGQVNGIVFLKYVNYEGKQVKDSCLLQNGSFFFKGKISEPTIAFFSGAIKSIADDDPNTTGLFIEPGQITAQVVKNHFKKIKIIGSKTQREYEVLQRKYEEVNYKSDSAFEKLAKINFKFITTHPDSYVSALQLALYSTRWSLDTVRTLYNLLKPDIQKSFSGREVAKLINEVDANSPGKTAEPFTADETNGRPISLLDFRGSYVLLDFWASWCVPCRKSAPNLIALFKKYHAKGLNIIGVSDDDDTEVWKKAIQKDKTGIWHNILSKTKTNGMESVEQSTLAKKFGVSVLPTKILIDKNGIIIGRYKGTEDDPELERKLREIF